MNEFEEIKSSRRKGMERKTDIMKDFSRPYIYIYIYTESVEWVILSNRIAKQYLTDWHR